MGDENKVQQETNNTDNVISAANGGQVSAEGSQETEVLVTATSENIDSADVTNTETASSTVPIKDGEEEKSETSESATHKQSKEENAFFKHMRVKAEKEAEDKYNKQMEDFKSKLKTVLPDGYEDVDEFLSNLSDDDFQEEDTDASLETESEQHQPKEKSNDNNFGLTEEQIDEIIAKKLENNPRLKKIIEAEERKEKEAAQSAQDKYIIDNYNEVVSKFEDIKTAEDIPLDVWEMWQLGNNGRSLLSCMKEYRYEHDIEKAKDKGAAIIKGQANSVAHTNTVNGSDGGSATIQNDVEIPIETQKQLRKAGIPEEKWGAYYKKYHR
jgi:hypothetical protein